MSGYAPAAKANTEARARKSLLEQPFMGLLEHGVLATEAWATVAAWNGARISDEDEFGYEQYFVRIPN